MVSGLGGLPGVHALKGFFHATVLKAVAERVQTPHQRLVARNVADTRPRTCYARSTALVSGL